MDFVAGGTAAGNGSLGASGAGGTSVAGGGGGSAGAPGATDACSARPGLLFCESFEQQPLDAAPTGAMWTTSHIGPEVPSIAVDGTSPSHGGSRSVKVHAPSANFQSFLVYRDAAILPHASGAFYLRMFVRLSREMAGGHNAYVVADRAAMPGAGSAVRFGEMNGMLSLTVGGDSNGALSNNNFYTDHLLGAHFIANQWGCLEGFFRSNPPEINFWLDGVEVTAFHHTDWPADNYDALRFGFEKYAGPELDIWFDDIAIGSQRIGCE